MYPIRLITLGRPKLPAMRELEAHYRTLLKACARLEVLELPEGRGEPARQLKEEAERLRPQLQAVRCPVLLSADGPARDSEAFARWLGTRMDRGDSLAFAVGSSHGFDPALKGEVREHLSLSPMTFPHDLSRILFLEQLYRAMTILKGTPYHK
jgi:23S rRNA (pseudouridine1915-N3)-methyltransferase